MRGMPQIQISKSIEATPSLNVITEGNFESIIIIQKTNNFIVHLDSESPCDVQSQGNVSGITKLDDYMDIYGVRV
jgi:hypothetical protein